MTSLILCKFPLFSTVKLKLGHSLCQFILRFKIGIFECWFWTVLRTFSLFTKRMKIRIFECCSGSTSQFFPVHESEWKLEFFNVNLGCTSKFIPIHKSFGKLVFLSFSFHILLDCEDSFSGLAWYVCRRGGARIKLPVFKKRNVHIYTISSCYFKCCEYCF